MTKFVFQGSGHTTGPDWSWLIGAGVAAGIAVAVALVVLELLWLIAALLIFVFIGVPAVWFATSGIRARHRAEIASGWMTARLEVAAADRARDLERHQRRLEIARASAPVVQNIIDPAALAAGSLAGLFAAAQRVPVTRAISLGEEPQR